MVARMRGLWPIVGLVLGCTEPAPAPVVLERTGAAVHGPARRDDTTPPVETSAKDPSPRAPIDQLVLVLDVYVHAKRDIARGPDDSRQRRVLFYCAMHNRDFMQCAVFDGVDAGAHLIGVEYMISADLYRTLPHAERQYWHSHVGMVDSGILIAPGLDEAAHRALMRDLRVTYGKSWRTWDTENDALPLGEPTLMWSVTPNRLDPAIRTEMRARRPR